ncbi:hypothetical protein QCA50_014894 [Cerrena zonata]|uniref:DUF6533 domain-containing protein n=1 Tax=Cerrena zonata TaxID=2478898 RepID=A0AAW0FRM7_9APHY
MDTEAMQQSLQALADVKYITFSAVTFWLYDFLLGFADEIRMVLRCSFSLPDIVYLLSRLLTFGHLAAAINLSVASPDSCSKGIATDVVKWFISLALPCNSFIFFLRARALYKDSRIAVAVFALLWTLTLSSFALIFGYKLEIVPNRGGSCLVTVQSLSSYYITSPFAALVVFDSAVAIAISVHLLSYIPARSWSARMKAIMFAKDLGRIPRLILRSGQVYYIVTIGIHMTVAIFAVTSISTIIVSEIALLTCALQNVMACRAHRLLRSGKISNEPVFLFPGRLSGSTQITEFPSSYSGTAMASEGSTVEHQTNDNHVNRVHVNSYDADPEAQSFPMIAITVTAERQVYHI